jgi:hypothetical protein
MKPFNDYLLYGPLLPCLYFASCLVLLIFLIFNLSNRLPFFIVRDNYFLGLSLLLLFISRLPSILYQEQLNVDESQMIAQALTLLQNPVYWYSVDGTTIGPINSYLLIWPGFFGLPITYLTARLTGIILISLTLWLLFAGFRLIAAQTTARFGLLLLVLFFSYTTHFDFLHYSSELASLVFVAAGWYYFLQFCRQTSFSINRRNWLIAGILIGCVPFAKLQNVPSAALIASGIITNLFYFQRVKFWPINKQLVLFLCGLLVPAGLFLAMCFYHGILDRFYIFIFNRIFLIIVNTTNIYFR